MQSRLGNADVPADADEPDTSLGDEPPREAFGGAEQLGDLGDGQVPLNWISRLTAITLPSLLPEDRRIGLRLVRLASARAAFQAERSLRTCRSRWAGGMWSESAGVTRSQV